jgi:hypothetical protein
MSDQILLARRHEQAHHSVLLDILDVPFMVGKDPFLLTLSETPRAVESALAVQIGRRQVRNRVHVQLLDVQATRWGYSGWVGNT